MYSFVTKIEILVMRALLDDITTLMLGLTNDKVEFVIVEAHATKVSVTNNNTFFLYRDLFFFLLHSLSILREYDIFP